VSPTSISCWLVSGVRYRHREGTVCSVQSPHSPMAEGNSGGQPVSARSSVVSDTRGAKAGADVPRLRMPRKGLGAIASSPVFDFEKTEHVHLFKCKSQFHDSNGCLAGFAALLPSYRFSKTGVPRYGRVIRCIIR